MTIRQLDIEALEIILEGDGATVLQRLNTFLHSSYLDGHSDGHREGVDEGEEKGQQQGFRWGFSAGLASSADAIRRLATANPYDTMPIEFLKLPNQIYAKLRRNGIHTVGDILARTPAQLIEEVAQINTGSVATISSKLKSIGITWE